MRRTGVFNEAQEDELTEVCKERHVKHRVGARDEREAVVEGIADRVHWMREEGKDAVEGEVRLYEEEEVAPV